MLQDFIEKLKELGLEYFKRYYSHYPAEVIDINDPEKRGRIKFRCPVVFGSKYIHPHWADPHDFDLAGKGHGQFMPPYVGQWVYISFEFGDTKYPSWHGGYYGENELPSDFSGSYPNIRGWVFKSGQKILVDESTDKTKITIHNADGSEMIIGGDKGKEVFSIIHSSGAKILISEKGDVTLSDKSGKEIIAMKDAEISQTTSGKFSVDAGGDANIKAKGMAEFSGTGGTTVGSMSSSTNVDGITVSIGKGAIPVAKMGAKVVGVGNLGFPTIGTIIEGSPKVFVP